MPTNYRAKYSVPVIFTVSGEISVVADSRAEAIQKAKDIWSKKGQEALEIPDVDVDFALGEDENSVVAELYSI